ncbi:hypothetical protein BDP27DRAFT_1223598, partial [Rhodocollybia butyracea]
YTIVKAFLPFTKSIVLVVRLVDGTSPNDNVIFKIYDPRFLEDRETTSQPWNLHTEHAAAASRSELASLDDDEIMDRFEEYYDDVEGQNEITILWEEWFYRMSMQSYNNERRAYANLSRLQGSIIPKFIGSGHL